MNILLAADGSEYTVKAAQYLVRHFDCLRAPHELLLLNVVPPIPVGLAVVQAECMVGMETVDLYYQEAAAQALKPAEEIFQQHNIAFRRDYKVGEIAWEINACAVANHIELIVMGSHGHGAFKKLVLGSVASKILALSKVATLIVR